MAIVKFYCDNGANIHSCRTEKIDTEKDWGLLEGEWESMSEDEKYEMAKEWAFEKLDIGYIE